MISDELVITGIGLASSLGHAQTACAAARAGITRAAPLGLVVGGPDTEVPQPVTGHPCPWVEGFIGVGRLIALLTLALEDLLSRAPVPRGRVTVFLDAPTPVERPGLQEQLFEGVEEEAGDLTRQLVDGLARATESLGRSWELQLTHGGHAGVLATLDAAQALLRARKVDLCIIGGVDSYMDLLTQEWLYGTHQLKHPNRAVGLMPGEGAAVLLVERASMAQKRGAEILARVGPFSVQQEEYWLSDDDLFPHGRALAHVIRQVMEATPRNGEDIRVILNDLNGQVVRAMEWGNALHRLATATPGLGSVQSWMPAVNFGDVGSASGAFSLCMATQALARGYAPGQEVLLCNSSERGLRAAAILKNPKSL